MSHEAEARKLRPKLDHPVVDGDGHVIESMPLFFRYLAKFGGSDMPDRYREELRRRPTGSRLTGGNPLRCYTLSHKSAGPHLISDGRTHSPKIIIALQHLMAGAREGG
jgi:hypothetical protein